MCRLAERTRESHNRSFRSNTIRVTRPIQNPFSGDEPSAEHKSCRFTKLGNAIRQQNERAKAHNILYVASSCALRIPTKVSSDSDRRYPPIPGKVSSRSERSDAGGLIISEVDTFGQI